MNRTNGGPPRPPDGGAGIWPTDGEGLGREAAERLALLVKTVETQVIPRLMLLHRIGPRRSLAPEDIGTAVSAAQVGEFTTLVLKDQDAASAYVEGLLLRGTAIDAIYLDLLAPTARRLGELWDADLCGFADVTIGLGRLQRVLRDLAADHRGPGGESAPLHRALLAPAPGEQHTFGLAIVMELFRQSGWLVWHEMPESTARLIELVREHWFDVIGFSIGAERHVEELAQTVRAVRRHSHNRAPLVLVGGPLLVHLPDLADRIGADAAATDARHAMLQTERLMGSR